MPQDYVISKQMSETVGFIGLGHMGEGMAKRLITQAGRKLLVWNRSEAKSAAIAQARGVVSI